MPYMFFYMRYCMKAVLNLSFSFLLIFFGLKTRAANLAIATSKSVDCSLNYVDFINSDHHLSYSLYGPHVILKAKELKKTSTHPFVKTIYAASCQRCGPSLTLGPIINANSLFKSWVASTIEIPKLNVQIELERILDTQPTEILGLKVSVYDETNPNTTTISALQSETSLSFQTLVNQTPGILNINCRVIDP